MSMANEVKLDGNGIRINGESRILFCASLFYFRIPHELWQDRIIKIKKLGYNCVDVYFPWNFHELSPGEWDFTGQRDVEAFLKLLSQEGIYTVARPGPYICSEWDGGSLPAWVLTGDSPVREAHKDFLAEVDEWYSRIMPVISRYQCGKGGTVVMVQLDNELDFFDCPDPKAYMGELRQMALKYGIDVPVFGCAGQGSAGRATGFAPGVEIAFNFYPGSNDSSFDRCCFTAYERMKGLGKPLLITETSRDCFVLRRELACGAKLIGPYNQVSGTNFGFTNSVNNWGKGESPLSFIASDYNFKSHISPAGEYDENVLESRLLSDLISTFGTSLASAVSRIDHGFKIKTDFTGPKYGFNALELCGGGWLLCIPNFDDKKGKVCIEGNGAGFEAEIGALSAPFFPIDIPLDKWGIDGRLEWASAELGHIYAAENEVSIIMYSFSEGTACFSLPGAKYTNGNYLEKDTVLLSGIGASCTLMQGDRTIHISIIGREKAARLEPDLSEWKEEVPTKRISVNFTGSLGVGRNVDMWGNSGRISKIAPLERHGLWRGYGIYRITSRPGLSVILKGVGDIISAYNGARYIDTRISGCQWQYYDKEKTGEWGFRLEIWGHSNFDDSRLDGMRLKSAKGIEAAFELIKEEDISDCWAFDYFDGNAADAIKRPLNGFEPLLPLNAWNTMRIPAKCLYRRNIVLKKECDALILRVDGNKAASEIYINNRKVARINPLDPFVDLSAFVTPGVEVEIAVAAEKKDWSEPVGMPKLLHCCRISDCCLSILPDTQVPFVTKTCAEPGSFPVNSEPGEVMVLVLNLDEMKHGCAYARLTGRDVKFTAVFNGRVVGRIFLESNAKPFITGGDPERFYLPGPWFIKAGNRLEMLVEAIGKAPSIDGLILEVVT